MRVLRGRNLHFRSESELREGVARIRLIEQALEDGQLDPDKPDKWLAAQGIPLTDQWRNSVRLARERQLGHHGRQH